MSTFIDTMALFALLLIPVFIIFYLIIWYLEVYRKPKRITDLHSLKSEPVSVGGKGSRGLAQLLTPMITPSEASHTNEVKKTQ